MSKSTSAARRPSSKTPKPAEDLKKSDATRQRILDAAALVLSLKGFAGTKLSDIAAQAKLKVATLYYYYESREALVEAVMVTGSDAPLVLPNSLSVDGTFSTGNTNFLRIFSLISRLAW